MKHVQVLIISSWTFDLNRERLTLGTKPKPRPKHRTGKFVRVLESQPAVHPIQFPLTDLFPMNLRTDRYTYTSFRMNGTILCVGLQLLLIFNNMPSRFFHVNTFGLISFLLNSYIVLLTMVISNLFNLFSINGYLFSYLIFKRMKQSSIVFMHFYAHMHVFLQNRITEIEMRSQRADKHSVTFPKDFTNLYVYKM